MAYYGQAPFDDYHRFQRPAAVVAQSMRGGDLQPLIDLLVPPEKPEEVGEFSSVDVAALRAFGLTPTEK